MKWEELVKKSVEMKRERERKKERKMKVNWEGIRERVKKLLREGKKVKYSEIYGWSEFNESGRVLYYSEVRERCEEVIKEELESEGIIVVGIVLRDIGKRGRIRRSRVIGVVEKDEVKEILKFVDEKVIEMDEEDVERLKKLI